MTNSSVTHAPVLWAQREKLLYLTIAVEDFKIDAFDVAEEKISFKGVNTRTNQKYENVIDLFAKVKTDNVRKVPNDRHVEIVIDKAEPQWWPRLVRDKGKVHWLKVNFDKWVDEDDQGYTDNAADGFDMQSMMANMGGMGGMGGMDWGAMGGDMAGDSDEDEMPDLEDAPKKEGDEEDEETGAKASTSNEKTAPATAEPVSA